MSSSHCPPRAFPWSPRILIPLRSEIRPQYERHVKWVLRRTRFCVGLCLHEQRAATVTLTAAFGSFYILDSRCHASLRTVLKGTNDPLDARQLFSNKSPHGTERHYILVIIIPRVRLPFCQRKAQRRVVSHSILRRY